jgi:hypothetical protein
MSNDVTIIIVNPLSLKNFRGEFFYAKWYCCLLFNTLNRILFINHNPNDNGEVV